eukprot:TRINITY_DN530_c0_g1_i1.p1 TRINITY_DN530_c0_g1~~TRINITY_DN530_c0_g1_i1.p1  ORF type:complete len:146 (-),score=46.83 TRINITY_DN530_c0_g1_i1:90-527(-)
MCIRDSINAEYGEQTMAMARFVISVVAVCLLTPRAEATEELTALVDLYHSAGGTGWRRSDSWLSDTDYCSWYGVVCHNTTEGTGAKIKQFSLYDNLLVGTVPASLGALTRVEYFALSTNKLSGTCLLYTSPSPRDRTRSRMPSSA